MELLYLALFMLRVLNELLVLALMLLISSRTFNTECQADPSVQSSLSESVH